MGTQDGFELCIAPPRNVWLVAKAKMPGSLKPIIRLGGQHFVLVAANLVHGLRHGPHDVKVIKDDLVICLWNVCSGGSDSWIPQVHRHSLNVAQLSWETDDSMVADCAVVDCSSRTPRFRVRSRKQYWANAFSCGGHYTTGSFGRMHNSLSMQASRPIVSRDSG